MDPSAEFTEKAQGLSKNPLGIIALLISLIYGFACLILGISLNNLHGAYERLPLIYFVIGFPVMILFVFVYLVIKHPRHLYGPGDYKDERNFVDGFGYKNLTDLDKATAQLKALSVGQKDQQLATILSEITNEITNTVDKIKQGFELIPINNLWQLNHWGSDCARVEGDKMVFTGKSAPKGTDGSHINLTNFLRIGETYKITCFAKSYPNTSGMIELWCHDNTGVKPNGINVHSGFKTPSISGETLSVFFRANFNEDIRIHIQYQPGDGRIDVSDIKIYKVPFGLKN